MASFLHRDPLTFRTVMLMIRTYALYDRSRRILVILILTHLAGAIMCLVRVHDSRSAAVPKLKYRT